VSFSRLSASLFAATETARGALQAAAAVGPEALAEMQECLFGKICRKRKERRKMISRQVEASSVIQPTPAA